MPRITTVTQMPHCAVLRRLGVPLASVLLVAGCGVPDESRWERGAASVTADGATSGPDATTVDDTGGDDAFAIALVEVGPVVAATEVRGQVRVVDPVVVVAEGPGRLERRTTAVGDAVAANDVLLEFSPAPDPTGALQLEILRIEREIALIEERTADVERLDADIASAQDNASVGLAFTAATPVDGTISEYFVSVFDVVDRGDPLFALGDAARRQVVAELPEDATVAVGDDVSLVAPRSALGDPIAGQVSAIVSDDEQRDGALVFFVELDADASFGVGDDVAVVFESATESSSLRLSADAVRGTGASQYVIVVDADGAWRRVAVDLGARTERFVQVLAAEPGLDEGDRVLLP